MSTMAEFQGKDSAMGRQGLMTPEEAERAVWSFYWQLDHSRDRRSSSIRTEPADHFTEEEIRKQQEQQEQQLSVYRRISNQMGRWFGRKKKQEYLEGALEDEIGQVQADEDLTGQLDSVTGLPMTANDLKIGRGVVTGIDLCLGAIIPPGDLAEAATAWLPDCPAGEDSKTWGKELGHWQAMGYKLKEIHCANCRGQGKVSRQLGSRSQGLVVITQTPITVRRMCEICKGRGTLPNWTVEECATVHANTFQIKQAVHRLSKKSYFTLRPINPRDAEMSDLVWEDEAGLTIGFRMTWDGYRRMKEIVQEDEVLRQQVDHTLHILALAGKDVRDSAPKWAQDEFNQTAA